MSDIDKLDWQKVIEGTSPKRTRCPGGRVTAMIPNCFHCGAVPGAVCPEPAWVVKHKRNLQETPIPELNDDKIMVGSDWEIRPIKVVGTEGSRQEGFSIVNSLDQEVLVTRHEVLAERLIQIRNEYLARFDTLDAIVFDSAVQMVQLRGILLSMRENNSTELLETAIKHLDATMERFYEEES